MPDQIFMFVGFYRKDNPSDAVPDEYLDGPLGKTAAEENKDEL